MSVLSRSAAANEATGPGAASAWPHVDVAICDYDRGLAAARTAAERQARGPSVLIVSHVDTEGDIRRALDAGVVGYLLLNTSLDDLATAVREVCDGSRYLSREVARRIVDSLMHSSLTKRELQVVQLVSDGASNKVIASTLDITVGTVKAHMRAVLDKLGASNRMQAAAAASRRGLLPGRFAKPLTGLSAQPESEAIS
jgi:DNA-binding NarL/FixJ family response regulator